MLKFQEFHDQQVNKATDDVIKSTKEANLLRDLVADVNFDMEWVLNSTQLPDNTKYLYKKCKDEQAAIEKKALALYKANTILDINTNLTGIDQEFLDDLAELVSDVEVDLDEPLEENKIRVVDEDVKLQYLIALIMASTPKKTEGG
jgi:BRCT domain type II-containing protein